MDKQLASEFVERLNDYETRIARLERLISTLSEDLGLPELDARITALEP